MSNRREPRDRFEDAHRRLLLEEKVKRRLAAGARIRGQGAFIATDIALRAMKEPARVNGDVSWLVDIDLAGLGWAGVDSADRSTRFICAGGGR